MVNLLLYRAIEFKLKMMYSFCILYIKFEIEEYCSFLNTNYFVI